eukprot:gene57866-biopygen70866
MNEALEQFDKYATANRVAASPRRWGRKTEAEAEAETETETNDGGASGGAPRNGRGVPARARASVRNDGACRAASAAAALPRRARGGTDRSDGTEDGVVAVKIEGVSAGAQKNWEQHAVGVAATGCRRRVGIASNVGSRICSVSVSGPFSAFRGQRDVDEPSVSSPAARRTVLNQRHF